MDKIPEFNARYSKNKVVMRPIRDGSGFKTRADRLILSYKSAYWNGREQGYIVTTSMARKIQQMYLEGWDAWLTGERKPPNGKN